MTNIKYFLILLLLPALFLILQTTLKLKETSQEMMLLRNIEVSLNLPKADKRKENDKGCYLDGKRARQYERNIYYNYRDLETIEQVRKQVESSGWKIKNRDVSQYENLHQEMFWYENQANNGVQIFIEIESRTINTFPHTMIISDTNNSQCYKH